ncbi:phosphoserine transaminase [Trueperella sp. LYQ143]|uniref:phosphoserine transaminase n=1 Tax=unclassified Trueperella TaxID=2630174 RepID=UPI0039839CC7
MAIARSPEPPNPPNLQNPHAPESEQTERDSLLPSAPPRATASAGSHTANNHTETSPATTADGTMASARYSPRSAQYCEETPASALPYIHDGRFGSGPSKVRREHLLALTDPHSPIGTSHRQSGVREIVGQIRQHIADLFHLPDGYEVILGNGGATAIWDAIPFTLVEGRAQCAVVGEFSAKAARAVERASWLDRPQIRRVEPGQYIGCVPDAQVDTYIYAHNETSTGVCSPLVSMPDGLTVVDGTSIAGGALCDLSTTDFYYFSAQKCFGADGGLWLAIASPAARERIERLSASRWVPDFLNLQLAIENSRKNQTLNTPAITTLLLIHSQLAWMHECGGLAAMAQRCQSNSQAIYTWAENHAYARPFIEPDYRSPVVCTVDFHPEIDAQQMARILRERGILDIEPYRSLGRNQLRIAAFPAIELADIQALLETIDSIIASGILRS